MTSSRPKTALSQILSATRKRVELEKRAHPYERLMKKVEKHSSRPNIEETFSRFEIVPEYKTQSPSYMIDNPPTAVEYATECIQAGAKMISVLTEPKYFSGEYDHLASVKNEFEHTLVLMKDFVVDRYQIAKAMTLGADCVLLISRVLEKKSLLEFHDFALELGMYPLIEVCEREEAEECKRLDAKFILVNNRNLKTMDIDLEKSKRLFEDLPEDAVKISASGLSNIGQCHQMKEIGYDGVLMGTALMKKEIQIETLFKSLRKSQ